MKQLSFLVFLCFFTSCNTEDSSDCFQTSGNIIQQEFSIPDFERILINRDVELILTQGPEFKVIIETGKNLLNDIDVIVSNDQLQISDHNNCNFIREYAITKAFVTASNLTEIRNSSQHEVSSNGLLNISSLRLVSENFNFSDSFNVGDFRLQLQCQQLSIVANGVSSFYLSGTTENMTASFFAGAGRLEAQNLIAKNINIYHRGSNDMIVNPQMTLSGQLVSTGNLISVNEPPIVDVQELFTGRLIFED